MMSGNQLQILRSPPGFLLPVSRSPRNWKSTSTSRSIFKKETKKKKFTRKLSFYFPLSLLVKYTFERNSVCQLSDCRSVESLFTCWVGELAHVSYWCCPAYCKKKYHRELFKSGVLILRAVVKCGWLLRRIVLLRHEVGRFWKFVAFRKIADLVVLCVDHLVCPQVRR